MSFEILLNGAWTTPPSYAMPSSNDWRMPNAPVVIYPPSAGRDGNGYPIRMDLELRAQIGRSIIDSQGQYWWWHTACADFVNGYANRVVKLWNPKTAQWTAYSGVLWEPRYGGGIPGEKLYDFVIQITNLALY
jgi:hypothetical protein